MMTCELNREVLSAGLDGETMSDEIAEALKHTGSCTQCLDYLKHLADCQEALHAWEIETIELPPQKIAPQSIAKQFFLTGLLQKMRPFPAIAFAAAAVLIAFFLIRKDKIEPPQTVTTMAKNQQIIYLDSRVKGMVPK